MRPAVIAAAASQGGVFTRVQAAAAGYTEAEIRARTRPCAPWVVLRRGVYIERGLWESLDTHVGQWGARDWAAHLTVEVSHALSHDSAGRALDLELLRPAEPLTHLTRAQKGGHRREAEVLHHVSRVSRPMLTVADGLPVTATPRTIVDISRWHGTHAGVVAGDSALRRGSTIAELATGVSGMTHFPGIGRARTALDLLDEGAESVGESLMRILVLELGIGTPVTQFAVKVEDGRVFFCDVCVGCHVFEFDGLVKFLPVDEGGAADEPAHLVIWREKQRERLVCSQGLGASRVVWEDVLGPKREAAKKRLAEEYAVTLRRYGDRLPEHMVRFGLEARQRRIAERRSRARRSS